MRTTNTLIEVAWLQQNQYVSMFVFEVGLAFSLYLSPMV